MKKFLFKVDLFFLSQVVVGKMRDGMKQYQGLGSHTTIIIFRNVLGSPMGWYILGLSHPIPSHFLMSRTMSNT